MRRPADPNVVEAVYDAAARRLGRATSTTPAGRSDDRSRRSIYAGRRVGGARSARATSTTGATGSSRVDARRSAAATLSRYGRVGAGPPAYAPDALPIRTVADELEQALLGPTVAPGDATLERVEEIVRRAFETVRLLNTDACTTAA